MTDGFYETFAHLGSPIDIELLDAIAGEHARITVNALLDRFAPALNDASDGLADYLGGWRERPAALTDVWNTGFRMGEHLAKTPRPDREKLILHTVQLGLAMQAAGMPGRFEADLAAPARLRFDGWGLPAADRVRVHGDGSTVTAELGADGPTTTFRNVNGDWLLDGADDDVEALNRVKIERQEVTFMSPAVFADSSGMTLPYPVACANGDTTAAWKASLALIREHGPHFLAAIDRVIRDVVPVQVPDGLMISGSRENHWGEVFMSAMAKPLQFAEMLIHEASHQYYFLGCMVADVQDGSDTELYYSPVKRKKRPLDKILLAYHAFANVILFYRLCQADGLDTREEQDAILPEVAELEKPLRANKALTPLGNAFWRPLAERLEAAAP